MHLNGIMCPSTPVSESPVVLTKPMLNPNPANDHLFVSWPGNIFSWEILNSSGKTVSSGENCYNKIAINTTWLEEGLYLIRLTNFHSNSYIEKILVKH